MASRAPGKSAGYLHPAPTALNGLFILGIIAVIYLARDFLLPVVLAFLIALTFRPIIRKLSRYGVPAWATAAGFAALLVLIVLVAAYLASGPISAWVANAPELQRLFIEKIHNIRSWFSGLLNLTEKLQDAATPATGGGVQEVIVKDSGLPTWLAMVVGYPANFVLSLATALVIALFLMASGDLFYEKLVRVLPTLADKKTALRIVYDVEHEVSTYLLTLTAINLGVASAVAVSFHLLGMPTPYLWGLLAFILNFIPYIGPIFGLALSGLVAIVVLTSIGEALLVPLAYGAVIGVESQLVSPYVLSRRLQLNSVAILLALAFWGWAWGIAGIVVAVPLLVTFRVFCSHLDALSSVGEFLGESANGQPTEPAVVTETTTT
jgi:predicted PurR-regulated permease PerM